MHRTLTGGGSSRRPVREGVVTGHLFKITRERAGLTQRGLAEATGVDVTTVQGWESGRRPLAAVPSAHFRSVRRHLLRCGADPALLVLFDVAMDADAVLSHALHHRDSSADFRAHPLAGWVFNRTSTHMIAWALDGAAPAAVPTAPTGMPRRRGPVPDGPLLAEPERRAVFAHLRRYAEIADRAGEDGALLRRQAVYLCGYDAAPDTHAWLARMRAGTRVRNGPAAWVDTRSVATSLTRYGEYDELRRFIECGLSGERGERANLNYWAHWLGLDVLPRASDAFMGDRSLWDGGALLRSLADRLRPELGCVELNVHSVWALLAARPGLLATDPALASELKGRVVTLLDGGAVSARSRRELETLHYGLKLNTP
ncbi:XRE family transcriptional regulator [Streptomyces armeniacus]|uniref:XRE family transcriptional regulator n=1 Tax=Streptomyces armeniacus TaxID=83291 RepID=A0A345XV31_9ACTN|nr:helix-turn-helix transcriptional regulator [Streptomyces armeniacus]AXK35497.1 XRE family transcriptional regulator [Streptomyces armeniacus]